MTLEELNSLRSQLPPFGEEVLSSPELSAYLSFYHIDFAAQISGVSHRLGYVNSGVYRLAVHSWQQPDAISNLLIVHGYYDHTGLFGKLIEWGLRHRCNVVAFDLPGHGLSTGEPAVINSFSEYGCAIHDVLAQSDLPDLPLWAMGQSTGCAALIEFARTYEWPFMATVMLAPLIRPMGWGGIKVAHTLINRFVPSLGRKFANNTGDRDFLSFIKQDPLQCHRVPLAWVSALRRWLNALVFTDLGKGPVLIVQGDNDYTVDWRYNVGKVKALFPESEALYLEGAGHQLANETPDIRQYYLDKVLAHLAGCGISLIEGRSP